MLAPLSRMAFITSAWLVLGRISKSSEFAVVGPAVEVGWSKTHGAIRLEGCLGLLSQKLGWASQAARSRLAGEPNLAFSQKMYFSPPKKNLTIFLFFSFQASCSRGEKKDICLSPKVHKLELGS